MKTVISIHGEEFVVLLEQQHMAVVLELLTMDQEEIKHFGFGTGSRGITLSRCTGSFGAKENNRNEPTAGSYWTNSWIWRTKSIPEYPINDSKWRQKNAYWHFPFPVDSECPLPPIPKYLYETYKKYREVVRRMKWNKKRRECRAKNKKLEI